MPERRPPPVPAPSPYALFEAARSFGLAPGEILEALDAVLRRTDGATALTECLDDVTAALARRILAKERRAVAERRRAGAPDPF